jgi:hypothetical protein
MYLINYVNVVACGQVGSSPPSVFRGVRFTSCSVDQVFSMNPLVISYSLPVTIPVIYVYIKPQPHPRVPLSFSNHLTKLQC